MIYKFVTSLLSFYFHKLKSVCLRDEQAVAKKESVHVKPMCVKIHALHLMYLEQVGSEKRAINTVDVYYKYQLIYKENQHFLHDLFKRIYYNKIGNILKAYGKPFGILIHISLLAIKISLLNC